MTNPVSTVTNCHFIPRGEQDPAFPLFQFEEDGRAIVNMASMLICPLECVLPHELEAISRRAHINRGLNGNAPEGYTLKNCLENSLVTD